MITVLVIDDDDELRELLSEYLQTEGFSVHGTGEWREGLAAALSGKHQLVVLDVMLPGISGFEVLQRLRLSSAIPVLMLTARGEDVDRIVGLEMGADDYLPKPFNPRELVARLRAIARRAGQPAASGERPVAASLAVGDVRLCRLTRSVTCGGRAITLTAAEFALLAMLLGEAGEVISRERLTDKVLGRRMAMFDRSVDVHVSSLRRKLGPCSEGGERIRAVRGVGYMYVAGVQPGPRQA